MTKKTIFIALDGNNDNDYFVSTAKQIAAIKNDKINIGFKIGLELFCKYGFNFVNKIEELEKDVFLDLKFFDISNTVCGALSSLYENSKGFVKYTTLHLLNGLECLKTVKNFNLSMDGNIKLLGVSILTSLDDNYLREQKINYNNTNQAVLELVKQSQNFVDGCICSPLEAEAIRNITDDSFTIVTPGVQMQSLNNDQKRTATPNVAFKNGANAIVVGRSIMQAADKTKALMQIIESIE